MGNAQPMSVAQDEKTSTMATASLPAPPTQQQQQQQLPPPTQQQQTQQPPQKKSTGAFEDMKRILLSLNDVQFAKFEAVTALERQRRDGEKKPAAAKECIKKNNGKKKKAKNANNESTVSPELNLADLLANLQNARSKMELALSTIENGVNDDAGRDEQEQTETHQEKEESPVASLVAAAATAARTAVTATTASKKKSSASSSTHCEHSTAIATTTTTISCKEHSTAPKGAPPTTSKSVQQQQQQQHVDLSKLQKQKRMVTGNIDRPNFYNCVVKKASAAAALNDGTTRTRKKKTRYYFVLHYNEESGQMRLLPMHVANGGKKTFLTGKHKGRPCYQCQLDDTDVNNIMTVNSKDFQVVPSTEAVRTDLVAQLMWDVQDDDDDDEDEGGHTVGNKKRPPISQTATFNSLTTSWRGNGRNNNNGPDVSIGHSDESATAAQEKVQYVDRADLRKQKLHRHPRACRLLHFYNRVVKPADGTKKYFFVLNCSQDDDNDDSLILRLVPLEAKGSISWISVQRKGRPRYQCMIGDTDENFMTVSAKDYQVVSAARIMCTPIVSQEAWDIEDDEEEEEEEKEERPTEKKDIEDDEEEEEKEERPTEKKCNESDAREVVDPQQCWISKFNELVRFKEQHGHFLLNSTTNNSLYQWLWRQRYMWRKAVNGEMNGNNKLIAQRIELLIKIGLGTSQGPLSIEELNASVTQVARTVAAQADNDTSTTADNIVIDNSNNNGSDSPPTQSPPTQSTTVACTVGNRKRPPTSQTTSAKSSSGSAGNVTTTTTTTTNNNNNSPPSSAAAHEKLRKQRCVYPRNRPHFYNCVVKPVDGTKKYFFVLHYNEDSQQIRLVPLEAKGTFKDKHGSVRPRITREGRPRYKCRLDVNVVTASTKDYQVVPATDMMRADLVARQAFDIEDDDDADDEDGEEEEEDTGYARNAQQRWMKRYNQLVRFKRHHGHFSVPYKSNEPFRNWIFQQIYAWRKVVNGEKERDKVMAERIELLIKIGLGTSQGPLSTEEIAARTVAAQADNDTSTTADNVIDNNNNNNGSDSPPTQITTASCTLGNRKQRPPTSLQRPPPYATDAGSIASTAPKNKKQKISAEGPVTTP